ncbi:MAG: hypothetical protein QNJ40_06975 [Xanthomonadales bacterium]|nr:hypothetical protein [Xanthomonadales bacterium]
MDCWNCGTKLEDLILPVSRREACRHCRAEIHVCRMCTRFRAGRAVWCAEDRAEPPRETELANFCDYFEPNPDAYQPADASADDKARAQLDALFGDAPATGQAESDGIPDELKKLFGD